MESIRLTQTVQKGGCAAKVAASELRKILAQVKFPSPHPELMIDGRHFDDAAIYKVSDSVAMVQTLDFFTPILDDPYQFGRVAACNALSDVYAMGGIPKTAMAILAFPLMTIESDVIARVLQGASDLMAEADCNFVGGHSIDDDTLKFGLSVTGFVHPAQVWSNQGAQTGDVLILTKGLGTGTLTAALKRSAVTEADIHEAIKSMGTLNFIQKYLNEDDLSQIHAATDITGFGLAGHSYQMAKASQKTFQIASESIPSLPRALEFLQKEFLTKAHRTNREYTERFINYGSLSALQRLLIFDPQTSGGLLLSVSADSADRLVQKLRGNYPFASVIGRVVEPGEHVLQF